MAVLVALLLAAGTGISPATAADGWKQSRNKNGEQLRWQSCVVTYAVDLNGHSSSRRKPLEAAIREVEGITGLDFRQVAWGKAALKVSFTHRDSGNLLASANWRYKGARTTSAKIDVFKRALRYSQVKQVNTHRHELGHVLGLAHVGSNDVMNHVITANRTRTAWRAGLARIYKGCRG